MCHNKFKLVSETIDKNMTILHRTSTISTFLNWSKVGEMEAQFPDESFADKDAATRRATTVRQSEECHASAVLGGNGWFAR